jgi:hypothetical protein
LNPSLLAVCWCFAQWIAWRESVVARLKMWLRFKPDGFKRGQFSVRKPFSVRQFLTEGFTYTRYI